MIIFFINLPGFQALLLEGEVAWSYSPKIQVAVKAHSNELQGQKHNN